MENAPSREELVRLVQRVMDADGTGDELDRMLDRLQGSVPHPDVSGLIFWPDGAELTAAEVVDRALAYRPIALP